MKITNSLSMVFLTIFCLIIPATVQAQKDDPVSSEVPIDVGVPDRLPTGDIAVIQMIADVTKVTIECSADSASQSFYTEIDVTGFDGVAELSQLIKKTAIGLKLKNPEDTIWVKAFLQDENGKELFRSWHGFYLEKTYDLKGRVSYKVPSWAGSVYFSPSETSFKFPGAVSAQMVDEYGNSLELWVDDDTVYFPGWSLYNDYKHLVIQTSDGSEYLYDARTGQKFDPQAIAFVSDYVGVGGIQIVDPVNDLLSLELYPEQNYCPWVETNFGTTSLTLDVQSMWGYQPIAVWIVQLDDLRSGGKPEIVPYNQGMEIGGTGTIYLYFEFHDWIYGIDQQNGGKG